MPDNPRILIRSSILESVHLNMYLNLYRELRLFVKCCCDLKLLE
jgi:hypothetical protein